MNPTLPTGQLGRLLAVGVTLLMLALVWFTAAMPLIGWHTERVEHLEQQNALISRMQALASALPTLRQVTARPSSPQGAGAADPLASSLLSGSTDAIAAASLQQLVQDMATRVGADLSSAETLPSTQAGPYRRIGLHVTINAPWIVLIHLLQAITLASPHMLIDDLQLHGPHLVAPPPDPAMQAGFTVFAFRAGLTAAGSR